MPDITRKELIEAIAKASIDFGSDYHGSPNYDIWPNITEDGRQESRDQAAFILDAIGSLGLAIVPVEPSVAFYWKAAAKHSHKHGSELIDLDKGTIDFWRAMLAASPLHKDREAG